MPLSKYFPQRKIQSTQGKISIIHRIHTPYYYLACSYCYDYCFLSISISFYID